MEVLGVEEKKTTKRGRVSLTQYLESQKDQNIIKLLNFTRTQERGRDGIFLCLGIKERMSLYSSSGGK